MPTRTQQADLLICAYASHGDTKHVLLLPKDPRELFEFCAASFDLAERLQTPVFVLEDLDIGMNDWLCEPFTWDDSKTYDRGKVMTAEELEAGKTFGRYLDVDGDAIPWRTLPGTHATKGAFFTRGTSRDRYAKYSEEGAVYQDNMQRLLRKFETAKSLVPAPVITLAKEKAPEKIQERTTYGLIFFGSSAPAAREALATLAEDGIPMDRMRIRAFPFPDAVSDFINAYDQVFLVEQNRDAQMRSLLVNECGIDPARFISILHYDGTPITARFIINAITERIAVKAKEAAE
jgi:2-oxoglutarate ferredoxin oxidoreductase subunit alpha